tara:strand:+ start:1308 stop:2681 length:1374 start_codon:yes stop_codon:yes gene_type:complete
MSIFDKLRSKPIEEANISNKTPEAKVIKRDWVRERPEHTTFERLIDYHDRTPQIRIAVASYSEMITGTDMNLTCKSEEAQKELTDWIRRTNFYDKFENLVTTLLITGNGILEKLDEKDVQDVMEVDMSTVLSKKRDEYGELEWYEQRTQNGGLVQLGKGTLGKFIEFNLTSYSRQPWGKSLFYSLAVPRTLGNRTMPPLVEAMWGLEDAMVSIVMNNAYPITTITYNGANDDYLRQEARRWQEYKPGDKRVQKVKPEIEFFESAGNSKFTDFVSHIQKTFELGTQFPHDILTGDFTSRASSDTTETIVQKRVRGYQRYLANKLKHELFDPILINLGYDPDDEDCQIQFTTQNVKELEVEQVIDMKEKNNITLNEMREWIRTNIGIELTDDKEIQAEDKLKKQMAVSAQKIKADNPEKDNKQIDKKDLESVKPKKLRMCKMCKEHQHALCTKRGCQCQ